MSSVQHDPEWLKKVEEAKGMTIEEKFILTGKLIDEAMAAAMDGIRKEYPGISDAEARRILRKRWDDEERQEYGP